MAPIAKANGGKAGQSKAALGTMALTDMAAVPADEE